MNHEEKIKLAKQVMQISGIFTLVVAALLIINFAQLKKYEPLESETLNTLVEQLKENPRNEQLKQEIRDFDMLVRKAYFTATWQVRTGAVLLLIGGILFALSLKVYTDIQHKIGVPDKEKEDYLYSRKTVWHWLLITGVVLIGLAIFAAYSSTNYIDNYYPEPRAEVSDIPLEEGVEVIEISGDSVSVAQPLEEETVEVSTGEEQEVSETAAEPAVEKKTTEKQFGLDEFKKQHNTFRGPMGNGISYHRNIPVDWDGAAGTNVIWKVAISKPGFNSPVIWGDRVFLSGADEEARMVMCYDRHTGRLLWERKADNIAGSPSEMPDVTDDTGLAAPTMAVDGYRVYAIFATGDVIAFDLEGNRAWARNLGVPRNHYGHSSSLVVWNNKLIVQYDTGKGGRMLALHAQTGETVWDISRDNHISWASPILVEYDGKVQVVTNTDPNVAGYDVETGEEIWKVACMMGEVGPSCAYDDGLVFANNEYASLVAINPEPGASIQWESYDYLSEAASPVAHDGLLFLATSYGVFVCYDTKSGEQVWEKDFGNTLYSSPMIVEGKVYQMDNTGVMHIMKADRSGTVISQPVLGEASYAIPAFAEGRIYIRGSESLYCIGK
ncbi:MAG: PQQ-binding-like beta-propeller repeat protein [Bacteroidales bacterium]|nr:PQQ-binding-like beta-propeller repeat protein [Bacteroidales bacterium]